MKIKLAKWIAMLVIPVALFFPTSAAIHNRQVRDRTETLQSALRNSNTSIATLKQLIDEGADVNARTSDGSTALHIAAVHDCDSIELLLNVGADINAQDGNGDTALMIGASIIQTSIIPQLLQRGAKVKIRHKNGKTALDKRKDFVLSMDFNPMNDVTLYELFQASVKE
jgi:ankyrin repeat protein